MVQNLTCVASPGLNATALKNDFDYICDDKHGENCDGINADAKAGTYGAFSMCNANDRLSWAFNTYYENQTVTNPANDDPCNFGGDAKQQTPSSPSSCQAAVNQAGVDGNGVITGVPTGTGAQSSKPSKTGAASSVTVPFFTVGMLQLTAYVVVAVISGAGVILL